MVADPSAEDALAEFLKWVSERLVCDLKFGISIRVKVKI
jgi:hypothetical protein